MTLAEAIRVTGTLPTKVELERGLTLQLFRTKVGTVYTTAYWIMLDEVQSMLFYKVSAPSQKMADSRMKKKLMRKANEANS